MIRDRQSGAAFYLGAALIAVFAYFTAQLGGLALNDDRDAWSRAEARVWVPSPRAARLLVVGYNEFAADVAWSRTLVYYGDGLAHDSTLQDVDALLALVNALDPRFRRPYMWGAYATVFRRREGTQEEYRGSIAVIERGLRAYPQDWELAWILGIRYYMDLKSEDPAEQRRYKELGADWIERAMRMPGAPADLPNLAAALRTELGQRDRALRELGEMILTVEDAKAREKLIKRYQELAGAGAAEALAEAQHEFETEWKATFPYAPPSMFVLVGKRPDSDRSPAQLLEQPSLLELDPE